MDFALWILVMLLLFKASSLDDELELSRQESKASLEQHTKEIAVLNEKCANLTEDLDAVKLRLRVKGK
jgi:hypothetical protein